MPWAIVSNRYFSDVCVEYVAHNLFILLEKNMTSITTQSMDMSCDTLPYERRNMFMWSLRCIEGGLHNLGNATQNLS